MDRHPANETRLSVVLNVGVPALVAVGVLIASVVADLGGYPGSWTQRSGNILIVVGAYVGYHEATKALQVFDDGIYLNTKIWYKVLAIALVLIGTVVSGYGDMIVQAMT
jgi:hypothetical protein